MTVFEMPVPTKLGPESNGMHMTIEEFQSVADWDESHRYELIRGVVIVTPAPSLGERNPNDELGYFLRTYRDAPGSTLDGTVPEHDIATSNGVRRADRVVWAGLGRVPVAEDLPTIVIEFVSRSSRDRQRDYVEKRSEYAELGVAEYWVIDRFDRSLTVCFAGGGDRVVRAGESYETELLPGFTLPLDELLAAADRYGETT